MNHHFRIVIITLALLIIAACQSTAHLTSMKGGKADRENLTKGEKRLWSMSKDAEIQIRRSGKLLHFKKSKIAVNNILDRLYPERKGDMSIYIVKHPTLNAFTFPNGAIYIHSGIIAAAKNEAQLATVIAHEAAHYILRHGAKSRIVRSNTTAWSIVLLGIGIPFIGDIIGASSIMGYSRDLEREADAMAAKKMLDAGYDLLEAQRIFEYMASDSLANSKEKNKRSVFFASHPELQERIGNFKNYASKQPADSISGKRVTDYKSDFLDVYKYALHKKLEIGLYSSLINELENDNEFWDDLDGVDKIIFADAYRLRRNEKDLDISKELLKKILQNNSNYWKPHFSLGILNLDEKNHHEAKLNFLTAKSLIKKENSYIEMYLNKLKKLEDEKNEI